MKENTAYPYSGTMINGFAMLFIILLALGGAVGLMFVEEVWAYILGGFLGVGVIFGVAGFFMLEPNQSIVTIFFGKYKGTITKEGYHWINPFVTKRRISLRINNLDVEPIKVNDKVGNPVMIGLVLVWKVNDTYRVVFDLNSAGNLGATSWTAVSHFVAVQSDAALREVAGKYPYDNEGNSEVELTLRSGGEEINEELEQKLNERLAMAGIEVVEARINYLAYAPEIAAVMLRRQQASAIITAREKIVEGAVTMVKMALTRIESESIAELTPQDKAKMVGNMLVVLCADEAATPVVNASN